MIKSTKAVLLSALVFPGAGHLYLKKTISGMIFGGAAIGALYYLLANIIERTLEITEKIQNGEVPLDVIAITELVSTQLSGSETQALNIATTVLIISWLVSIFDSYRIGRVYDKDA